MDQSQKDRSWRLELKTPIFFLRSQYKNNLLEIERTLLIFDYY